MSADTLVLRVCGPKRIVSVGFYDEGGQPDLETVDIFGSHILPAPVFNVSDFDKVLDYAGELSERNPEAAIVIEWRGRRLVYIGMADADGSGREG